MLNFNISGSPIITQNVSSENTYLLKDFMINVVNALGQNAMIGVTVQNSPTEDNPRIPIAKGEGYTLTASDVTKFVSDDDQYKITFENNTIYLGQLSEDERIVIF